MGLDRSTFEYLKPTDKQISKMAGLRQATADYAGQLDALLPEGPDKTYILRKLREVAMWINITITRNPDGSPRRELPPPPCVKPSNIVMEDRQVSRVLPHNETDAALMRHAAMNEALKQDEM